MDNIVADLTTRTCLREYKVSVGVRTVDCSESLAHWLAIHYLSPTWQLIYTESSVVDACAGTGSDEGYKIEFLRRVLFQTQLYTSIASSRLARVPVINNLR